MAEKFDLFGLILGASFAAGIAVLVVIVARLILKKAPKRWSYIMWAVVFFRCLCPFSAESSVSIFNALNFAEAAWTSETAEVDVTANTPDVLVSEPAPVTDSGYIPFAPSETVQPPASEEYIVSTENVRADGDMPDQNYIQNVYNAQTIRIVDEKQPAQFEKSEQTEQPEVADSKNSTDSRTIFTIVWLCGVGAIALYGIVSAARLAARVKTAVRTEKGIYESDRISTAFAAGLLRPKIYIPCGIPDDERRLIVMHERVHIRRRDYLFKLLAFAGLSLHWFNPLIWAAFALMTRDMEMSCDEAVLRECGESGRILYAEALLRVSVRGFGGAAVVGFGETGIKKRVKNVLSYKKPGKLAAVAAAMVMLASCTMAGTDAVDGGREDTSADSTSSNVSAADEAETENAGGNGNAGNTEPDDDFDLSRMSEFYDRCITLSAREPFIVIGSPEVDGYRPKNVWLIPIDRTGGITGMGAENFIIDDDGVVTATFRIHCGDRKVASPADGEVLWADGTCVVLDTEYGAVTYGDMKEVELKAGDKVVKGEPLGRTAGVGYTGYAVQASMSISEAFIDVDFPISSLYCRTSVSNGAYTYTSSETRFLGDNADTVRLLETVDLYEKTPWYEASDGRKEFSGTSFSPFKLISDMADGEQLRQKQNNTDSKLSEQELRLQEEELQEELRRLREEEERLKKEAELRRQSEEAANAEKFSYPFSQFPVSAADIGEYGANEWHVLFAVPKGTEVLAAEDGTVKSAKKDYNMGYGNCMEISHDDEMSTFYAHLDKFAVKVGDKVKKGDVIGYSGNSGDTVGDALLFEIRKDGIAEDPRDYYSFSEDGYRRALEEIGKDYEGGGIRGIYYENGQETIKIGSETYYLISTEEQLRAIAADEYGMDKNFMQKANIQLSSDEWIPIGTKENPFTGSYNGNGFEIIGLTITDPDATRIGMFGWTEKANVYNITLRDYDIESAGRNAKRISVAPIVPVVTNGTRCYDNHVYPAGSPESASVLVKPCPQDVKISSLYGKDNENSVFNKGIDYMAAKGTEVYAAADGKVLVSEDQNNGYGMTIIIDHGGELTTLYAHLNEALVSKNDEVKAGDLIGYSGHTGNTYGDALHFEVRENGQHVDPMNYFKF